MSRSKWWRWLDTLPAWRPEHWCARKLHDEERQARRFALREGIARPEHAAPGLPADDGDL